MVEGGSGFVPSRSQPLLNTKVTLGKEKDPKPKKKPTTTKRKGTGEANEAGLEFPRWGSEKGELLAVICTLQRKALGFLSTSKKSCPAGVQPLLGMPGRQERC